MTRENYKKFINELVNGERRINNYQEFEMATFDVLSVVINKMQDAAERCIDKDTKRKLISALGDAEAAKMRVITLLRELSSIQDNSGKCFEP